MRYELYHKYFCFVAGCSSLDCIFQKKSLSWTATFPQVIIKGFSNIFEIYVLMYDYVTGCSNLDCDFFEFLNATRIYRVKDRFVECQVGLFGFDYLNEYASCE